MKQEIKDILTIAAVLCVIPALIVVVAMIFVIGFLIVDSFSPGPEESIGEYQCTVSCAYYIFQDGTRYKEYQYSQVSFDDNPFFEPLTADNAQTVRAFVRNVERCVDSMKDSTQPEAKQLYQSYRYDLASLSEGDYFYLQTKYPEHSFHNYDLYIFNAEEMTLYYFENVL